MTITMTITIKHGRWTYERTVTRGDAVALLGLLLLHCGVC